MYDTEGCSKLSAGIMSGGPNGDIVFIGGR
jgi:hypothetical protein